MKKCQAITKGGATCAANGAHIVMVWTLSTVAYPHNTLPERYADAGWEQQMLNFCGAHKNVLASGDPINISTNSVETDKPKEGINMTNKVNNITGVFGCYCNGSGTDPDFGAPCKCTEASVPEGITDRQAKYLADLIVAITAVMKVNLEWANVTSKKEASNIIGLLKEIKDLVLTLKAKKKANKVTTDQVEAIRDKINAKPEMAWINAAKKKLATL